MFLKAKKIAKQKDRYYVGNGKVFWNDGKVTNAVKPEDQVQEAEVITDDDSEDLPF